MYTFDLEPIVSNIRVYIHIYYINIAYVPDDTDLGFGETTVIFQLTEQLILSLLLLNKNK